MLLNVNNLSVTFHTDDGDIKAVDNVSFSVAAGKTTALVGESGSGKSVTALTILRLLEKTASISSSGEIFFHDRNILQEDEKILQSIRGNRIAMIFQEPMTSLNPVYSIGEQLIEPLILHQQLTRKEAEKRAVELLDRTGIPEPAQRFSNFPHQLSGGQRQRVMIAMALACRPQLLIADEPTTALDVTIQAQIIELLKDLQQELNMAVLLITHDLPLVKKIAEYVHIMQEGRIVENGKTEDIFSSPSHPYTIKLLQSIPAADNRRPPDSKPIVDIRDLNCFFPIKSGFLKRTTGYVKAVQQLSLQIKEGTTYGIVGESGSGKSTLGQCILKLVKCDGRIIFSKNNILAKSEKQMRPLRREMQIVFQDPFSSLSPRHTVEQIISEGLKVHKIAKTRKERRRMVLQAMAEVGLEPAMIDRYPHEFSGGQRQRIAIARVVILKPRFLVLDEPTSALDMTIQAQIIELLRTLQKKHGMTYLFISHDLRVIRALADEVAVMQNGRIVECGPAADIFAAPTHPYTKSLFAAAFEEETVASCQ